MKEKKFKNSEKLIKSALLEFGKNGYEEASLNNILKASDISKGTFYYHFKNKEELYFYLFDILFHKKLKFFRDNLDEKIYEKDIFSILKEFCRISFEFAIQNKDIELFSIQFLKDLDSPINTKMVEKYDYKNDEIYQELINRAYKKDELREDLPREFILNTIKYLISNYTKINSIDDLDGYAKNLDYLIDFLKDGLMKK